MVKKTYKELLDSLKYSDLGYTGERKPLTDPKYKQFTDTINKNTVIANTHIDSSLPKQMPQAQVSGQGTTADPTIPMAKVDGKNPWAKTRRNAGFQDPKGAEVSTVGSETTVGGAVPTETPQPETVPTTTDTSLTIDAKYSDFVNWAKQNGVDSDKVFQDAMALARTQYEQSRATYGMKAEQLAQAGLTNSGVSDNLERAAYAQKVQAEQAALDQKAALDQANKQAYGAYKEQQRQQYTDLFQKFVFGYEDEYGNIHAPVSPDEAVALLKLAGLTDDAMIADLRKSYDDYKGMADKKAQEQQFAIAGIDSATGGFSADSMFGKLFDGTLDSEDFLDQIEDDYGVRFNTDEEAVAALLKEGKITKEQSSLFYREMINNSIEAIVESGLGAKGVLSEGKNNPLYQTVAEAQQAYKDGKMSKADWDAFRKGILNGGSAISINVENAKDSWEWDNLIFSVKVGDKEEKITVSNGLSRRVTDEGKAAVLDNLSSGTNFAYYDDALYVKVKAVAITPKGDRMSMDRYDAEEKTTWVRVGNVTGTKKENIKSILEMLAGA